MKGILVTVVCAAWLLPAFAHAQPRDADGAKAAQSHFDKGGKFFASGEFGWAIDEFRAAYELSPEPRFLFHLGLAHEAKGDKRKAVAYFERYLEQDPEGEKTNEAGTHIAKLTAEIELEDEAAREKKEREEAEAREKKKRETAVARRQELLEEAMDRKRKQMMKEAIEREKKAQTTAARRACRKWKFRRAGLITAGVGVLSLAIGAKYGLDAKSANDALTNHTEGPWTDDLLARHDPGRRAEKKMVVFTSIGGVALVTGGVFYLLGRRGDGEKRGSGLRLQSSIDSSRASLSLVGRF